MEFSDQNSFLGVGGHQLVAWTEHFYRKLGGDKKQGRERGLGMFPAGCSKSSADEREKRLRDED